MSSKPSSATTSSTQDKPGPDFVNEDQTPTPGPLQIKSLYKNYGINPAVVDVSFSIKEGEIFGLLGPNGAGKTSIIAMITTLEKPTSGEIRVFDLNVVENPLLAKASFGVVHQEIINTGFFDVEEVMHFQSGYYGMRNNKGRENYLLERLGLWPHRAKKIKQLSGGMKRRLMIAKALVNQPKLLMLDEPTAGVDMELRDTLWTFLDELKKEKVAILLTTHYLHEAEQLCDRIGILDKGHLYTTGYTGEIIAQFSNRRIILTYSKDGGTQTQTFTVSQNTTVVELLRREGISLEQVLDIAVDEGSLEEAFMRVLKKFKAMEK